VVGVTVAGTLAAGTVVVGVSDPDSFR